MVSRSDVTNRLTAAWYGLIWLLLLAAASYLLALSRNFSVKTFVILLGIFIAFSIMAVRPESRLFACLALTTLLIPLYLFETYLWLRATPDLTSSKVSYIAELRAQGFAAYPAVFPSGFLDLWLTVGNSSPFVIESQEILPLAGIPNVLTVYCQAEDLSMITYSSDPFGFRNPAGSSRRVGPTFALLGDSFVQGTCVSEAATYVAQLSILGASTSYGMNGTSALAQMAIFREYVQPKRPHHVMWFFYEGNDLNEYLVERTWPLLQKYLERDYVQDLVRLNSPVSLAMKRFIDKRLESVEVATLAHDRHQNRSVLTEMVDFLLLRRARSVLQLVNAGTEPSTNLTEEEWREISNIWAEVIETQREHGGQVTFVYIPTHLRFLVDNPKPFEILEQKVESLWSSLGADHVTLTHTLEASAEPLKHYEDGDGHFNAEGYRLTAKAIVEHLSRSRQR
jgi:hypothetical protein